MPLLVGLAKYAVHIGGIYQLIGFLGVMVVALAWITSKERLTHQRKQLLCLALAVLLFLALAPLAGFFYLKSRGMYQLRVTVLGPDNVPVENARVVSSAGGEPKKTEAGWEFDISPQTRPQDGKVTLYASEPNAFLVGTTIVTLAEDYFPVTEIKLASDTTAMIRGRVVDRRGEPVAGAKVSVAGFGGDVATDSNGNFELQAHAANGQVVEVDARADALAGTESAPAGRTPITIVVHP